MPKVTIFYQARNAINRNLIERFFPGGSWRGSEYFVHSPLRDDQNIGSFSINEDGLFFDFATNDCGDFIDLVAKSRHVDKIDAARIILGNNIYTFPPQDSKCSSRRKSLKESILFTLIPENRLSEFKPEGATGIWIYRNFYGKPWCIVTRFEKANSGKFFIPYYFNGSKFIKGNPLIKNRPLYNVDRIKGNDLPVVIVEGEKCASITLKGYVVVTWIGGCKAVDKSDFSILKDRKNVTIIPDADKPGLQAALKIKEYLPDAEILKIEDKENGWDIADAISEGIDLIQFIHDCPRIENTASVEQHNTDEEETRGRPRKSKIAMELLANYHLCRFQDKRYIIIGNQAVKIGSRMYKEVVAREYFRATGEALTSVQIDEIVNIQSAYAGESEERQIYIRIAAIDDSIIYIDLNDGKNTIIEVTEDGWQISENPSVLFLRPTNMGSLPIPLKNGSVDYLKNIFNFEKEEDFPIMISYLCFLFRGRPHNRGAYPIIVATGIEGSAKTTFIKIIKKIIDPGTPETRTPSKKRRDLFIAANNCLLLSLDNISNISRDMSDALCSLATGGGFTCKKNYSDDEEQIVDICRPILLNGISFNRAPDLLSRSIIIELRPISPEERRTESEIWTLIEKNQPSIFGGLLSMLSNTLKEEKNIQNDSINLPRLADFGLFSIAFEKGNNLNKGQIISGLSESYETALFDKAEESPIIPIIVKLVTKIGLWTGSTTELFRVINGKAEVMEKRLSLWPKTPASLGILLKRYHNVFASHGINIRNFRDKSSRRWELSKLTDFYNNEDNTSISNIKTCKNC